MSETKFTRGEWEILRGGTPNRKARNWTADYEGETDHQEYFRVVSAETGDAVALAVYESDDFNLSDECQANARLIAAAPELYAALLQAQEYLREFAPESEYNDNETLLKKARGEA